MVAGNWNDDRGWSEGWDSDTIRGTNFDYGSDAPVPAGSSGGYAFGAAHQSGMNAVWADGSVRPVGYEVDGDVFNDFADRRDGKTVVP